MYSISDIVQKTGLSASTLRYYEKQGLLPGIGRSAGGIRQYTEEDLESLGLICCLKNTGMPLEEIGRFVSLAHEGDATLSERAELLKEHRKTVLARLEEMQAHLRKVDEKLSHISERLRDLEK